MRRALLLLVAFAMLGCVMPRGTPVWVSARTGAYWSGKGTLLEVSDDQERCRVAVRDRALFVHRRWVPCKEIHERRAR